MPIHLDELNVAAEISGQCSASIIPCYMCPAVTLAVKEEKPFLQLFSHFLKSQPFERYIRTLQSNLKENGVSSSVFKSHFVHQWFLCMWSSDRRKKLMQQLQDYEYVIVLGCNSATETVRDLVKADECEVIQGMELTGFMNAKLRFHLPGNICFEDCKVIPLAPQKKGCDI